MYVSSLRPKITIQPAKEAQIALLLAKEVIIPAKYSDFANEFLEKLAKVLLERTKVNEHVIELEKGKQPSHKLIYSLKPIEPKTFKTYIKTNLANGFIRASKSSAAAPILFIHKPNDSFCLCGNNARLNNLKIKN